MTGQDRQGPGFACFHPGCPNPVIGQCQGFPEFDGCGRFYCQEHSQGRLCNSCAQIPIILEDYLHTAQRLGSNVGCTKTGCLVSLGVFFSIMAVFTVFLGITIEKVPPSGTGLIGFIIGALIWPALPFGLLYYSKRRRETLFEKAHELERGKPGFVEFYLNWLNMAVLERQAKIARIMEMGVGIVGSAVSAAAKAEKEAAWEGTRMEVEAAASKINKYFSRPA